MLSQRLSVDEGSLAASGAQGIRPRWFSHRR